MNHERVVNSKVKMYDIYIGRPSKWGNPFTHLESDIAKYKVGSRIESIQKYADWIVGKEIYDEIYELENKVLGCFCEPNICHGTVLAELADRLDESFKKKEIKFEGDIDHQIVYSELIKNWEHIEIEGSKEFIDITKKLVDHLNNIREHKVIVLTKKEGKENIISYRM